MDNRRKHHCLRSVLAAAALGASCAWGAGTFVPGDQPFGDVPQLALTGFNLSTGTQKACQVYFNPFSWSGDVSAYPVSTTGQTQITAKLWSAFDVFRSKQGCGNPTDPGTADVAYFDTTRIVVTRDGTTNIPFRWSSPGLSNAQKTSIDADIAAAGKGDKIHRYIRGDRANEKYQQVLNGDGTLQSECGGTASNNIFRARVGILGDALHTRPVFVGAPPADYTFDSYPAFKSANTGRAQRLFVGTNDGMVHAFDVISGEESWAYIPSMLIGNLKNLSVDPYTHNYYVDGQMTAGDVNFGTTASPDWRTIIVGGLGAGGKGLFALDVTSASAADETEAKAKILWEITPASTGYGDLGYTYGTPVIARMNTGDWVAIVNNGYLNGGTGRAVLYIIDIKTGLILKTLDTGAGTVASPNGLSSAIAIDTTFDGRIDRIYAGDIDGNLWKFDVSGATTASWGAPTKLFPTATDITNGIVPQAILGAPDVAAHPLSGFLVFFATGRLLTGADAADATVQNYAYGLWDGAPAGNTTFLNQTLTERLFGSQRVRVSSGLPINWNNTADPPVRKGWRTALPAGERVIGTGFVRDARYQFTSISPTIVKTPPPNGENWLIELDYLTGGAADKPVFDLNADSLLSDADRDKYIAADTIPAGKAVGDPISGAIGIPVAVYMGAGLLSQPVLANVSAQLSTTLFNDNPYVAASEQPAVPPATPPDRGVAGGHFDIDIYYAAAGAKICTYTTTGTAAVAATVTLDFTYGGNKTADSTSGNPFSIKIAGVEQLSATNPGSKSGKNLASWIASHIVSGSLYDVAQVSNTRVVFTAKTAGLAGNGKQIVITTGTGMTASDYTGENTSTAGGADATPGVETFASCVSKKHFHEYDDIFNVTVVNMLNSSDASLNLSNAPAVTATTQFKVILHNQYLNPAVTFSIGGAPYVDVKNYTISETIDLATLPSYTKATVGTLAFNMPVDAFSQKNWWGGTPADSRVGLHPTQTGCVNKENTGAAGQQLFQPVIPPANGTDGPGTLDYATPLGVRHNGAMVFQLIRADTPNSAIELNVAGRPEYGWRVKKANFETYVLAEWTAFWHHPNGKCYNAAGWTKLAPPDTSPSDPSKYKTPVAGSADPGFGTARVTVTSSTSTTTTSGGTTTTVVTVVYSNGSSLIVTTVTTGGVSTTTSQFIPASSGSPSTPPPGGTPVGQAVSSPNTITGYQQTRNSGKLGRVTWHEVIRQ